MSESASIEHISKQLVKCFKKGEEWMAVYWILAPNVHFGGTSPASLIMLGRGHKVQKFIDASIEENQPPEKRRKRRPPKQRKE